MKPQTQTLQAILLCTVLALAAMAAPAAAAQASGALVFSLKFINNKLEVNSITLVPGEAPDYNVEPNDNWLAVDFVGDGTKVKTIRVADPRKLWVEVADQKGQLTSAHTEDENASLVFAAPNLPEASRAEITDQGGVKLLSIDYRKAIQFDAPNSLPATSAEFDSSSSSRTGNNLSLAAFLGAGALAIAYLASKENAGKQKKSGRQEDNQ